TMELKKLNEELSDVVNGMQELARSWETEGRSFTDAEKEKFDSFDKRRGELTNHIETLKRSQHALSLNTEVERPETVLRSFGQQYAERENLAARAWFLTQNDAPESVTHTMRAAADDLGVNLNSHTFLIRENRTDTLCRDQSIGSGSAGGYLTN